MPATLPAPMVPQDSTELWRSPATRPASRALKIKALWTCLLLALVTAMLFPFAGQTLARFGAFLPAYQTAVILEYVICAYLIFGHFTATHSVALLHLASSCIYTALILVAQFLSFPGMFAADGVLPGGAQTTIWLWAFWHVGPVVGLLLYAAVEWRHPNRKTVAPAHATRLVMGGTVLAVAGSILAVTTFHDHLPVMDVQGDFSRIVATGVAPTLQVLMGLTLLALWRSTGFKTVLQVWMGISIFALLCDNAITMAGGTRLSVGWYAGRLYALLSASVMLVVYLREINNVFQSALDQVQSLTHDKAKLLVRYGQARIDALTGLAGRGLVMDVARDQVSAARQRGDKTAVLYIDLDGFKQINDTWGHARGDEVLKSAAQILTSTLRDRDTAGRLGGDEFVAVLSAPPHTIESIATLVSQRLIERISGLGNHMGCSIGIATETESLSSFDTILQCADAAMYEAKRHGKNQFRRYADRHLAAPVPMPLAASPLNEPRMLA